MFNDNENLPKGEDEGEDNKESIYACIKKHED